MFYSSIHIGLTNRPLYVILNGMNTEITAPTGKTGRLNKQLNVKDYPWLDETLPEGLAVFAYLGCTYGCISDNGVAVCLEPNSSPFTEIPAESVDWL